VQVLLNKNPEKDIVVYTIWFKVINSDSRSAWPSLLLTDDRVTHFWDEKLIAGPWFAGWGPYIGIQASDGYLLWDAFLLFSRTATWGKYPQPLWSGAAPVIYWIESLEQSFLALYEQ
tara:strand:- start:12887 stop:13237 length:351 start_codon:yes stop_codon:yes gene_type:complete